MLVRRIATVTISAPEASIAARVSAKSLYLPVPTSSRERYGFPATTSLSSAMSTAAHCDDDLEPVAVRHHRRAVRAPWHDLAIALHRDFLAGKLQRRQKRGNVERALERACVTVYSNLDHGQIVARNLPGSANGNSAYAACAAAALLACSGPAFSQPPPGECPQPRFTGKAPDEYYGRPNPLVATPEHIAAGRRVYEKDASPPCQVCHGAKGD